MIITAEVQDLKKSGHTHGKEKHVQAHTHGGGEPVKGHTHGVYEHHHPNAKAVSNRLAKAIGHLESVKRMIDRGEDCSAVLIQLAAVKSAVNNAGKVLLMDHISHCMVDAVRQGNLEKIDELNEAIRTFVK